MNGEGVGAVGGVVGGSSLVLALEEGRGEGTASVRRAVSSSSGCYERDRSAFAVLALDRKKRAVPAGLGGAAAATEMPAEGAASRGPPKGKNSAF